MANEIQITTAIRVAHGSFLDTPAPKQFQVTQSGIGRGGYTQTITDTEAVIDLGDIAVNGFLTLANLDTTNWVVWGPESGGAMVVVGKLKPGESAGPVRIAPSVILRAQADTNSSVKLDVSMWED